MLEGALPNAYLQPVIDNYSRIVDDISPHLHAEGRIAQLYAEEPFATRLARICDEDEETYFDSEMSLDIR